MSEDGSGCLGISEKNADIAKMALLVELAELVEMADMRSKSIVF